MKLVHIPTKYVGEIELPKSLLEKLPNHIYLATTIQFKEQITGIKKQLEKAGKKVDLFHSGHGREPGQILGCDVFEIKREVEGLLYVGDGYFHPTAFQYSNKQKVYSYNPFNKKIEVLENLEKINKRRKGSLAKFYASDLIGVLVTTKPGQNNLKRALAFKEKIKGEGKTAYIFLGETLDMNQLENYPFIQSWVNTSCPRIIEDTEKPMINLYDLVKGPTV